MRTRLLPLLVLLAALVAAGIAAAEDMARLEKAAAKHQDDIAEVWSDLADWLADHGHKSEALSALERANPLASEDEPLKKLAARIEAMTEDAPLDAAAEKRVEKARGKAAKGYDKLAKVFEDEPNDPRLAGSMLKALALDPSKRRLVAVADLAKKDLLLMQAPTHPFAAWVSFPKAWKPGHEWPVLVVVDGAGANHRGAAQGFENGRGSRDWIIVGAHALSCTNVVMLDKYPAYSRELVEKYNNDRPSFDIPGLLALLDYLHEQFGAEQKVYITGFSGGGILCYGFTLQHPDRVAGAAPACANFTKALESGAPKVEDGGPPVHIMTGEKDPNRYLTHGKTPPGIEEQADGAEAALKEHGFTHVTRTMLPGVAHSACRNEVWTFLDEVQSQDKR